MKPTTKSRSVGLGRVLPSTPVTANGSAASGFAAGSQPLPAAKPQPDSVEELAAPILIVDDEPFVADLINHWVHDVWDYPTIVAYTGDDAIVAMREKKPRLVLLDLNLPDIHGIDVLRAMKSGDEHLPVVMISAQESVSVAVEALKAGAYDYLTKPIDTERLQVIIRNALQTYSFHEKLRSLRAELNSRYDFSNMISADPRMHDVFKLMRKACTSDITVCIFGDSGTGKELVARALHANSDRRDGPFQVINCAAIPHELLESELFGHEKGSFTGAIGRKIGKFEAANGGTLFLDEIGDMELMLQAKLLRAIQEREFERVGGTEAVNVDVRIICATNSDLREAIAQKRFRDDLYYRIATFPITLPRLAERKGDILLLAESFLRRFSEKRGLNIHTISHAAIEAMMAYPWPGNIRELESTIERAVLIAEGDAIHLDDLPIAIREYGDIPIEGEIRAKDFFNPTKNREILPLEDLKKMAVQHAWDICKENLKEASERLDISRSTMYRLIEVYNIQPSVRIDENVEAEAA